MFVLLILLVHWEWYGGAVTCLMPFLVVNNLNPLLEKVEPLSVTGIKGIP